MKHLKNNWFCIVGVLVIGLLGLHYSGILNKTNTETIPTQDVVEMTEVEKLQEQVERELKEVTEFEQVVPAGSQEPSSIEGYTMTGSGLQYKIVSATEEGQYPQASDTVRVHYHGTLLNGTVFDSSVDRGEPATFPLYRVIPGWTEGLQLMSEGDTFDFVIPAVLAYGDAGAGDLIGPNETLQFQVELLEIIK